MNDVFDKYSNPKTWANAQENEMDLRERFARDLMDTMWELDKSFPKYDDIKPEDRPHAHAMAEGMIKRGWHFKQEENKP